MQELWLRSSSLWSMEQTAVCFALDTLNWVSGFKQITDRPFGWWSLDMDFLVVDEDI